jgi:hypothetical protein
MLQSILPKMTLAMKTWMTKLIQTTQMKIIQHWLIVFNQSRPRKGNLCWSRILILSHRRFFASSDYKLIFFISYYLAYSSFIRAVDMTKLYDRKAYNQLHNKLKTDAVRSVSLFDFIKFLAYYPLY